MIITTFHNNCVWIGETPSMTYKKRKKSYAYLVVENVGNFQNEQGWHSGSHVIAWAAITTSAH